jgi:pimeloyl-ACP methyl ester carboxylesterase
VLSEPETRYVKSGDAHIAYQVVGDGPVDLIVVRGYISHVEVAWESPALASFYRRLASFCRLILFDKRGTGLSDRVPEDRLPTLEQRMDDVRAVMEAVGSERAALFGASEGGPMCLLFAATYPERTLGLLLWGCFARYDWRRSFIGRYWGGATLEDALDRLEREWGDGGDLAAMAPLLAGDDAARRAWGRAQRLSATPTAARALLRMTLDIDVRPLLPAIRVPVVILHRADEVAVDVSHSRYMAEHIPGARYVELPGSDHLPWIGDVEPIMAEVQELMTGTRPEPEPDRVVATVMFVDAPHAELLRSQVARFRGEMLAARGDRLGASFDGPARAIRCAEAIAAEGDSGRAGLHTGECEPRDGELRGVAFDMAAEILARAAPGEVLVSRTVADLVAGARIGFVDRGSHTLATVGASWHLIATSAAPARITAEEPAMQFRREGDYWTLAFGGDGGPHARRQGARIPGPAAAPSQPRVPRPRPAGRRRAARQRHGGARRRSRRCGAGRRGGARRARQARVPRADRRAGGGGRAGASLERPGADGARGGRARGAHPRARRCPGPRRARSPRGFGQRASAGQRDQGRARRPAANRGPASRAGPAPRARLRTGTFCSYEPDPRVPVSWEA